MSETISQNPEIIILSVVLQNILLFGLTVGIYLAGTFVLRVIRGKSVSGYGLGPLGLRKPKGGYLTGIAIGVLVGFGALILSLILNAASSLVLDQLGLPADNSAQAPLMNGITDWVRESPGVAIPLAFFAVVLLGPAVEELVFRGAIFGGLYRLSRVVAGRGVLRTVSDILYLPARLFARPVEPGAGDSAYSDYPENESRSLPPTAGRVALVLSVTLSSVLFALLHFSPVLVIALFTLAVVLCELYRRSGSLLAPFVAHATFNSFAVIALVLTGLDIIQPPA